jgi:hypothetical protein
MEKEILKISNGYLLTMNDKTVFYSDFASMIVNAFAEEVKAITNNELIQIHIKSEIL